MAHSKLPTASHSTAQLGRDADSSSESVEASSANFEFDNKYHNWKKT
jgi:hypothetical protein